MRGRPFQPGNTLSRGRPKGALKRTTRELAAACREILTPRLEEIATELLDSDDDRVRLDAMRWLADRGYGRAPEKITVGLDPDSAEYWLLKIAGQPIPGEFADDDVIAAAELPALEAGDAPDPDE